MGKTPFKMKGFSGFGNSPMTKKSPAKDDPHTTTETHEPHKTEVHEMTGTLNKDKTRVVDEKGEWAGVGDRPDLVPKPTTKETEE